uniref:Bromo domain-containing protein n=1 Tax=Soboliphyme baturini TaxID=241478 RepID=A0A183IAE6_9BILA
LLLTGERFQAIIDDCWWYGTVLKKELLDQQYMKSHFQSLVVLWDNGEEERMSPWDLNPIESRDVISNGNSAPASAEDMSSLSVYRSKSDEWPSHGIDVECQRLLTGIDKIMEFPFAEPFTAPVDLNAYPFYCFYIEYPSDLSTIRSRIQNRFYRYYANVKYAVGPT